MKKPSNFDSVTTPCYVIEEALLKKNLEILARVKRETGCKVLLAQKCFSMYYFYPLIGKYLDGVTASGLYEAKLGYEELCSKEINDNEGKMKKCENHIFSPAYPEKDMNEILQLCDHLVFNSFHQWKKYRKQAIALGKECGLRINPECSTQEHGIYDPCAPGSRFGVTISQFEPEELEGLSGLHFHTLCEQNVDALEKTLSVVEEKFGKYLYDMKWLNFGGGHHVTRDDYDVDKLIEIINRIQDKYNLTVYIEPGEAVALNAGFLVCKVEEIVKNGDYNIAIVDTSAACHMPDVIEMPYRPPMIDSGEKDEKPFNYILGGPTCLAGDIIGEYSFDEPLEIGQRLVFGDMAIYSMVKNNTFNGMKLPDIVALHEDGTSKIVKSFGYADFKSRV